MKDARTIVMVMFAATFCTILLASVGVALFYPPGTVHETFRVKIFEMLAAIVVMVTAWLALKEPKEPKE